MLKNEIIKIYLAGRIPFLKEEGVDPYWREEYTKEIKKVLPQATILDPSKRTIEEKDSKAIFGHDLYLIRTSNLLIVNADVPLGLGTSQELIIAKYFKKPMVVVSPKGSYYSRPYIVNDNKANGIRHPFLDHIADIVIENLSELKKALVYIREQKIDNSQNWDNFILDAINYYKEKYLDNDVITKEMLGEINNTHGE